MWRRFAFLCVLLGGLALVGKGWHFLKKGFAVERLFSETAAEETAFLPPFAQPFYYLGKGRQFYAFQSADGLFVLKIARLDSFRLPFWCKSLALWGIKAPMKRRLESYRKREQSLYESLWTAIDSFSHETGVNFLHLPSQTKRAVKLVDALGRSWKVPLAHTAFVIQKKADLFIPLLASALKEGRSDEVVEKLTAFLDFAKRRALKQVIDKDPHFETNLGWAKGAVVQIDVGTLQPAKAFASVSFSTEVDRLELWLKAKDFAWAFWLKEKAAQIAEELPR